MPSSSSYLADRPDWLARRHEEPLDPDLRIIDAHHHLWTGLALRELASCPNVRIKIGGVGMRITGFGFGRGEDPPTSEELSTAWRPYVETAIEAFRADRCMFGSDFPVDKGSYGYDTVWNAFKRLTGAASASGREALFSGMAERTYRPGL
jgi:L-fuconolactonase